MKKVTSWTINEELLDKIKKDSERKDRSKSWIVNNILNDYYSIKEVERRKKDKQNEKN